MTAERIAELRQKVIRLARSYDVNPDERADFNAALNLAEEALRLREALERIGKRGHLDTCSCALGDYPCDCHVAIARAALAKAAALSPRGETCATCGGISYVTRAEYNHHPRKTKRCPDCAKPAPRGENEDR